METKRAWFWWYLGAIFLLLLLSGFQPKDRLTWWLEVIPVILGMALLFRWRRTFPFTPLLYTLIFLHALILMVGGHYTYAEVPLGDWLRDAFHWQRNHFDRLGHFAQGFVPAILAREFLRRKQVLAAGGVLFFIATCICLAFSATYELLEWLSALVLKQGADAFLGTQGDPWDTQWDMFLALCGAISSQILLGRLHEWQMRSRRWV